MNIGELRINNLVQIIGVNGSLTGSVEFISKKDIVSVKVEGEESGFFHLNSIAEPFILPVQLNHSWLNKLGFQRKDDFLGLEKTAYVLLEYVVMKNYYKKNENKLTWSFSIDSDPSIATLKYVHELQNLFHALTGIELTIS